MAEQPLAGGAALLTHHGRCHCGAVRFRVEAPQEPRVQDCNCSMCARAGYLHLIVPASQFHLDAGAEALVTYTFNTGVARHTFCRHCAVKAFYVPRSNPDGVSVNLRCLDPATLSGVLLEAFDGRDWEAHGARLAGLSRA